MADQTVRLKTFQNMYEAEILKDILSQEGIECFIITGTSIQEPAIFQLVNLKVHINDLDKAKEILKNYETDPAQMTDDLKYQIAIKVGILGAGWKIRTLKKQLMKNPEDEATILELGYILFATNQLKDAIVYLSDAIKRQPSNVSAHFHLGCALSRSNCYPEAIDVLKKCVELDPNYTKPLELLAACFACLKDEPMSVKYLFALKNIFDKKGNSANAERIKQILSLRSDNP